MPRPRAPVLIAILAALASAVLLLAPVADPASAILARGTGAVVLGIGLLATRALPEHLTSVVFYFVCLVFAVAPPEIVFSGFHSGAVWLVFGGLVTAAAVERCGLGDRLAGLALRLVPASYTGILGVLSVAGLLLAFLVPSGIGRIALIVPFAASLARQVGFEPGSRPFAGLVIGAGMATIVPANAILTANLPPLVLLGAAQGIYRVEITYLDYLAVNMPVLGLSSLVLMVAICSVLFGAPPGRRAPAAAAEPWSPAQRRLLAVILVAVGLWITDSAHGIAPAWVALGAGIACLLPRVGVLGPDDMVRGINLGPWFFVAGVVGLGAVATHVGLGEATGRAILASFDLAPGEDGRTFAAVVAAAVTIGLVTTSGAMPAVLTPIAQTLAEPAGWSVDSVIMAQVPGFFLFVLPYQVPPMVLMAAIANVAPWRVVQVLLWHFALATLVLPLHFSWARALGYMQ